MGDTYIHINLGRVYKSRYGYASQRQPTTKTSHSAIDRSITPGGSEAAQKTLQLITMLPLERVFEYCAASWDGMDGGTVKLF